MSVMKINDEAWLRLPPELRERFSGKTVEVEQFGEGALVLRIVPPAEEREHEDRDRFAAIRAWEEEQVWKDAEAVLGLDLGDLEEPLSPAELEGALPRFLTHERWRSDKEAEIEREDRNPFEGRR